MRAPRPAGSLSYMELDVTKERPCPRCGGDLKVRGWNEFCKACKEDPSRLDSARIRHNRKELKAYYARKKGT